ncbi:histidinol-phosphatase [Ruminococcaceae bacterium OttesenSCG-928-D13]|nr:histidinol-phosphatase [Ruminococcaceae bacterium OttesenSCG-928-D13]
MRPTSNVHTHSTWCDGQDSPRQMAERAIELGYTDLGFSSHGPAPFDPGCPGIFGKEAEYRADIRALAEEYADRLNILCGVEADLMHPIDPARYDYVIGSVHYLPGDGPEVRSVDNTADKLRAAIDNDYGGDGLQMAADYFSQIPVLAKAQKPQIIGHFDLVAKYNGVGVFFDEESPAYQSIALEALDDTLARIKGYGGMVEVNTGAMARGVRKAPYPAPFLLRHAAQRGARMIITSDCHNRAKLGYGYDAALAALREAGFTSMAVLKNGRFEDVSI